MAIQEELRKDRTLITPLGRKHKFLERWGDDLFRSANSFKPQSTVGDLLNHSLCRIYYAHGDIIHLLLQLHDAIYVMAKEEDVQGTIQILRRVMLVPIEVNHRTMLIDVDFKVGDSWGEQDEVDWQDYTSVYPTRESVINEKGVLKCEAW